MDGSNVFVRGQVWHWEDPICMSKDQNIPVPSNSSLVHFSRYVIIIQNTDTISNVNDSVLVIPCSSKNRYGDLIYDVKINIGTTLKPKLTHARCASVFPASINSLSRYICTLSESTMKEIEAAMFNLLIAPCNNVMSIQSEPITPSVDVPNEELTNHCSIPESVPDTEPIVITEVSTVIEEPEEVTKVVTTEDHKCKKWVKYTYEEKLEFFEYVNTHGVSMVAENYGIPVSTIYSRIRSWNKKNSNLNKSVEEQKQNIEIVTSEETRIPDTSNINHSIYKISNMIVNTLESVKIFNDLGTIYSLNKSNLISSNHFYKKMRSAIYDSLMETLSVRKRKGVYYVSNINNNSRYLTTYHFLDKIHNDNRISSETDGEKLVTLYKTFFSDVNYNCIQEEVINGIDNKIKKSFDIKNDDSQYIIALIKAVYCYQ